MLGTLIPSAVLATRFVTKLKHFLLPKEAFRARTIVSSVMPYERNLIRSERLCSIEFLLKGWIWVAMNPRIL